MPIKNFLSQEQKQSLQQALRESEQPELRERVLMLLLMNEGKTYEQIASFIGCSQRTVAYWCVHGDPDKIESLKDKRGDNASYHKRKDIIADIEKDFPNIILEFLPAYSPDFNLIELVWHSCKEYIAHRLFQSVTELEEVLNKLLNEGELIIKWARKIKNKGNAVNAS